MAMTRLDSDERRKAIVAAAVPLFARKGFAGTTTRELAEAAGISEALLFRHFPTKKQLYGEILRLGCEGDPALERLAALEPSSATLVHMIHFMVRYFLLGVWARAGRARHPPAPGTPQLSRRRRICARAVRHDFRARASAFCRLDSRRPPRPAIWRSDGVASANRFWFGHHIAAMMAFVLLPGRASIAYQGALAALAEEASRFILRGIGLNGCGDHRRSRRRRCEPRLNSRSLDVLGHRWTATR